MSALRFVAVFVAWAALTTLAAWVVGPRDHGPGPLDVLAVKPAQADPPPTNNPKDIDRLTKTILVNELAKVPPTTTTTRPRVVVRAVVPRPAPRPQAGDRCGGWRGLVDDYAWNVDTACRVLLCESGGRADAVGRQTRYGTAKGLMQIMGYGSFDPATNIAQAYAIYASRGWGPWVCQ